MAITGVNSENKDMRVLAKELLVDGQPVTPGGETTVDWADVTGKPAVIAAGADAAAARLAIGAGTGNGTLTAVPAPTASVVGGVKLGTTIAAPAALTATADTASTATDVAGLLTDHNDLVTKYNALLTDVTAIRTGFASVLAQLKAQTIPASA